MDNYNKKEIEVNFRSELKELLKKYNANLEVDREDLTVDVEIQSVLNSYGDVVTPYCYFVLPRYMDGDSVDK